MEFEQMKVQLHALISNKTLLQATISQPRQKSNDLKRVKITARRLYDSAGISI